jgi:chromate reductase, NAD(P)H dehydrogenase (quinone)
MMRILGVVGSLRENSFNQALLRAAAELAPEGVEIVDYDIRDLPLFNSDVEAQGDPEPVRRFKQAIWDADGVLFVTPEYNYGTTGALKNAIDWANRGPRGPRTSPMAGKPVFIMGATPAMAGTTRAQLQVREAMVEPGAHVLLQPQVLVAQAHQRFDEDGRLTHEPTRQFLATAMREFADWTNRLGQDEGVAA